MQVLIEEKIREAFAPENLHILNESYMHNVPKNSETHFKVMMISDVFKGKTLVQRHRLVNSVLKEELKSGVHALSINAMTIEEGIEGGDSFPSPTCLGGMKKEQELHGKIVT